MVELLRPESWVRDSIGYQGDQTNVERVSLLNPSPSARRQSEVRIIFVLEAGVLVAKRWQVLTNVGVYPLPRLIRIATEHNANGSEKNTDV